MLKSYFRVNYHIVLQITLNFNSKICKNMKRFLSILSIIFLSLNVSLGQQSFKVTHLPLDAKMDAGIPGNLNTGQKMNDLSWAWQSNVACFVQTQQKKFTGNHVLYSIDVPSGYEYEITVTPKDPSLNLSLYGYMVGEISDNNVPRLSSCIRCEADFKWDYKKRGLVQDHSRTIKYILATTQPYKAIIGVVGAEGLAEGDFVLRFKRK